MGKISGEVEIKVTNLPQVMRQFQGLQKGGELALERTLKDFKGRAPGWIAREVSSMYNIKAAEVRLTNGRSKVPVGRVAVKGKRVGEATLTYKGRVLTPTHFGMTPRAPRPAYTLKATVFRGRQRRLGQVKRLTKTQRKNVGRNFKKQGKKNSGYSPIMLMPAGGGKYIPMQRQSRKRNDIKAIKTLSLPQMVENPWVNNFIQEAIDEKLSKRFYHHLERCVKKGTK